MEIREFEDFKDLPEKAVALLANFGKKNPFVADYWLGNFDELLIRPGDKARYIVLFDRDEAVALLPMIVSSVKFRSGKKIRVMANFYTAFFELPRNHPEINEEHAHVFASYFIRKSSDWVMLEFEPIRADKFLEAVVRKIGSWQGYEVRSYVCHKNLFEKVNNDNFETYWARRPSKLRNTSKRKLKKLLKLGNTSIKIIEDPQEFSRRYTDYIEIYNKSWKPIEFSPEFISRVTKAQMELGCAKLGIIYLNTNPVAAQIWFRIEDAWAVFKLAYDPDYRQYSVGTILTRALIESFFKGGHVSEIDFLSGADTYKKDWVSSEREHYGIEVINRNRLVGKALALKRRINWASW